MMFIHGTDKEGRPIRTQCSFQFLFVLFMIFCLDLVWFHAKHHKKDDIAAKQLLIFWLEKHYFESKAQRMAVFFDMSSTGLQNMVGFVHFYKCWCDEYNIKYTVTLLFF